MQDILRRGGLRRLLGSPRQRTSPRRCILHVGSPKTATSSIQFILHKHRRRFEQHGILVPQSGQTESGSHRHLAFALAGAPDSQAEAAYEQFAREVLASDSETVLISSEFLWDLLMSQDMAAAVMERLRSLDLEVTLQMYVRNQPQCWNSFYQHSANFRKSLDFHEFVESTLAKPNRYLYSYWTDFAETYGVPLQVRPFCEHTRRGGVVADFLATIGGPSLKSIDTAVERNRSMGPFRVAVAQTLMRGVVGGRKLSEHQASNCRRVVRREMDRRGIDDSGYCGLTTAVAARIEERFSDDNDRFAAQVWGRPWRHVFARDVGRRFEPNDYALTGVPAERRQLLSEVLHSVEPEIGTIVATGRD